MDRERKYMTRHLSTDEIYKAGQRHGMEVGIDRKAYRIISSRDVKSHLEAVANRGNLSIDQRKVFNNGFYNTFDKVRSEMKEGIITKSVERAKEWVLSFVSLKPGPSMVPVHVKTPKHDTEVLAKSQEKVAVDRNLNPYTVRPGDVKPMTPEQSKAYDRRLEVEGKALASKQQKLAQDIAAMPQYNGNIRDSVTGHGITPREHSRAMDRLETENRALSK